MDQIQEVVIHFVCCSISEDVLDQQPPSVDPIVLIHGLYKSQDRTVLVHLQPTGLSDNFSFNGVLFLLDAQAAHHQLLLVGLLLWLPHIQQLL